MTVSSEKYTLDHAIKGLERKSPFLSVQTFCDAANHFMEESSSFLTSFANYARNFWLVTKEQFFLKNAPYACFRDNVCGILTDANNKDVLYLDTRSACLYRDKLDMVFCEYFHNRKNFLPLATKIAKYTPQSGNTAGDLVCAVRPDDGYFLVASGIKDKPVLPDFDFTAMGGGMQWLMPCYKKLGDTIPDASICLVDKRVGPIGPVRFFRQFEQMFGQERVFVLSQFGNYLKRGAINPAKPVIIAYDLYATGDGLTEISTAIRNGEDFGIAKEQPVIAFVLHDFAEYRADGQKPEDVRARHRIFNYDAFCELREACRGNMTSEVIRAATPTVEQREDAPEEDTVLDAVVTLNIGDIPAESLRCNDIPPKFREEIDQTFGAGALSKKNAVDTFFPSVEEQIFTQGYIA